MSGIERHRTALHRTELSRPVRLALDDGVLTRSKSFFDYGCGRGTDIRQLRRRGFDADGWDPAHWPGDRRPADVVNLGYVVNVIEDPEERLATVQEAWRLAQEVLVVAARLETDRRTWLGPTLGDGMLTRLGTFQKYFAQDELTGWVNEATGQASLAAAPGVLYVFRDPARREDFAASQFRSRGRRLSIEASADLYRENSGGVRCAMVEFYCDRGRLPRPEEFMESEALARESLEASAEPVRFCDGLVGPRRWDGVRRERSADLLVYLALARFPRETEALRHFRRHFQWDIRSLFSTYRVRLCATADTLLVPRWRKREAVDRACRDSPVGKAHARRPSISMSLRLPSSLAPATHLRGLRPELTSASWNAPTSSSSTGGSRRCPTSPTPISTRDPHPGLHKSVNVCLRSLRRSGAELRATTGRSCTGRTSWLRSTHPRPRHIRPPDSSGGASRSLLSNGNPGTTKEWLAVVQECRLRYRGHRLVGRPPGVDWGSALTLAHEC